MPLQSSEFVSVSIGSCSTFEDIFNEAGAMENSTDAKGGFFSSVKRAVSAKTKTERSSSKKTKNQRVEAANQMEKDRENENNGEGMF